MVLENKSEVHPFIVNNMPFMLNEKRVFESSILKRSKTNYKGLFADLVYPISHKVRELSVEISFLNFPAFTAVPGELTIDVRDKEGEVVGLDCVQEAFLKEKLVYLIQGHLE
ncbi:MAG: hypothetical protein KAS30_00390, partial [Candidatus Diapherotrites archaeon]|nr:hypothetical protein [Candidatus Diapherotrites archaeon]